MAEDQVGYPVMVKASEGGGGKGIRMANNATELEARFEQARSEVPFYPLKDLSDPDVRLLSSS